MKIAICVISYNRPASTLRCLSAIKQGHYDNDNVDLIISIDYSGDNTVQQVANDFVWKHGQKRIIAYKENLGLREHILKCGDLTQAYDALIVLEDDIVVSPAFYRYAKATVNKYSDNDNIAGISLYSFGINYHNMLPFMPMPSDSDVYLMQNAQSWGQIWMPRQWKAFMDWYEQNTDDFPEMPHLPKSICSWRKSWLKYHTRYCIEKDKYFVYPYISLSTCFSDTGEHTSVTSSIIQVPLCSGDKHLFNIAPSIKYDAFFENKSLSTSLGLNDRELCTDIYGEKGNRTTSRYWLTREIHNYKILAAFGLQLKPVEENIIHKIVGTDVFLYDTHVVSHNQHFDSPLRFQRYLYNNFPGIKQQAISLIRAILNKLNLKKC